MNLKEIFLKHAEYYSSQDDELMTLNQFQAAFYEKLNEIHENRTDHEFMCLMGDAYCSTFDTDVLEKQTPIQFEDVERLVKYILYNEFDIEVANEAQEL